MYNLDEIIRFNDAKAATGALTLRPDVWILPFLNIYGIIGKAKSSTEIDAGVWLPDTANVWSEVTTFSTTANFDATSFGFGMTPTIGVFVFGPRLGKTFKFKKPEQTIALWVGGFRVKFTSETKGSLDLAEIADTDELQGKVDQGFENVNEKSAQVETWWGELTPAEQKNPLNAAKYETANRVLTTASNLLTSVDGAINDGQTATVQYSLEKNLKDPWNFVIGSQFQINKHFMIRAEYGFLGSRTQIMGGLQYRFGL